MKPTLDQILEIYFLGGGIDEILSAVGEYREYCRINYIEKTELQMFSGWR